MTNHISTNHPPKEVKQCAVAVKWLNNHDLNDRAFFILMTVFVFLRDM